MTRHSFIKASIIAAACVFLLPTASDAAKLTKAVCDADMAELSISIEANRQSALDQINVQLAETTDKKKRQPLIEMREKAWDLEEQDRGLAKRIHRDCMAAVK